MPSSSATIWANVVSWPWPCDLTPILRMALPVGCTRSSALSNILKPRMSNSAPWPAPTTSVKLSIPMPVTSPFFLPPPPAALLQLLISELAEGDVHRLGVIAAVVYPAGRGRVRELLGLDEVPHPELGLVEAQLQRRVGDEPLDQVARLCHAEGT